MTEDQKGSCILYIVLPCTLFIYMYLSLLEVMVQVRKFTIATPALSPMARNTLPYHIGTCDLFDCGKISRPACSHM